MIFAGAGDDQVFGGERTPTSSTAMPERTASSAISGNDLINAGAGDDTVFGGAGDDLIVAEIGDGNDVYFGDEAAAVRATTRSTCRR